MRAATASTESVEGMQTLLAHGGQTRSGAHNRERLAREGLEIDRLVYDRLTALAG